MKHKISIIAILLTLFFITQVFGLVVLNKEMGVKYEDGEKKISYSETVLGPRPEMKTGTTIGYLIGAIVIGTLLVLLLVKTKQVNIWKGWFFLSVFLTIAVTLDVFMGNTLAIIFALILASIKVFKPNVYVHNLTEPLVYTGLAVIFVPIMNVWAAVIILVLISLYDMYAVWKSKHMVAMAKFQSKSNIFAGLLIPYKAKKSGIKIKTLEKRAQKTKKKTKKKINVKTALLGGGDIAFPLFFAGAVMQELFIQGATKTAAIIQGILISLFAMAGLFYLFKISEKGKFYPAMPFITIGCFIGYIVVLLIGMI